MQLTQTPEEVVALLIQKGFSEEVHEEEFNPKYRPKQFGFKSPNKHVWHWFDILSGNFLIFNHSYSQNTGSTKKGYTQKFRVTETLERAIQTKEKV